ncbi:helix-turn-helix domain-containing protein [Streptomyces griseoincarnatus]
MESGADSGGRGGRRGRRSQRGVSARLRLPDEAAAGGRGLTQAQLGERVGYGEVQIAAVEQGRRIPRPELVDAVDREVGGRAGRTRRRNGDWRNWRGRHRPQEIRGRPLSDGMWLGNAGRRARFPGGGRPQPSGSRCPVTW